MGRRREVWVVDCETDPFKRGRVPKPFVWGLYTGEEFHTFTTTQSFVDFIIDKEVVIYAHNGGRFDFHFLSDWMMDGDDIMLINARVAKFRIGIAEFRDSYNILNVPLADYKKTKIDYSIFEKSEREKPANWQRIVDYLRDDCMFLYELVRGFIDEYGMHLTQAGASVKVWEKISEEKAPRSSPEFHDFFRPFYYGGRVQCFEQGIVRARFRVVDINSAYPHAMMHQHPISLSYIDQTSIPKRDMGPMFFTVECIAKGCFPWRDENGEVWYPDDDKRRSYSITGWELQAAMETGAISKLRVIEGFKFSRTVSFAPYVEHFYAMRKVAKENGDKAASLFCKIFLNSLYGKFGADPRNYGKYELMGALDEKYLEESGVSFAGTFGKWYLIERPLDSTEMRFYNVATAASITGFVRAYLWRTIKRSRGVLYCDTDSIAARDVRGCKLSTKLGDWSDEGAFDYAALAGKKLYAFRRAGKVAEGIKRWKIACKGAKLTAGQIVNIAKGGTATYRADNPTFSPLKPPVFLERSLVATAKDAGKPRKKSA